MKQQFYVYGDKNILKDIRIKRYITAEESDTYLDVLHTIFDGEKLYAYYAPDISSYIVINYKNKLFFLDEIEDFERVSGFEESIEYFHIIDYMGSIYVGSEMGKQESIKATMTNTPIDNNISEYTKLVPYENLNYSEYGVPKEKLEEVFFNDIKHK